MAILIEYASKYSTLIAMHHSCYMSEAQHFINYEQRVQSITEKTEVLWYIAIIDQNINITEGRVKHFRRLNVFLGAAPKIINNGTIALVRIEAQY